MQAFHDKYDKYTSKIDIAYSVEMDTRGVFAKEDIDIGDVLLRIPKEEILQGTHLELTFQLRELDNIYTRHLPTDMTNFPVLWTPMQLKSLEGSAMREMILSRKQKLMEEMGSENALDLRNRLLVGSRGFTLDKDTILLVPYADMMNHSAYPNVDWKYTGKGFLMRALKVVKKGDQLFDTYGTKTNYENLLFYGMVLEDNLANDVTYQLMEIPTSLRKNLNYDYFKETIEFELCGSYSRGTKEIFSFLRFLVCANASKKDCPKTLLGFSCEPISLKNEQMASKILFNALLSTYNDKIVRMKDVNGKVADFVQTEINILLHWIEMLPPVINVLEQTTWKKAKKALNKLKPHGYIQMVVRPLVTKNSYKST
jgi:hypothetical protein